MPNISNRLALNRPLTSSRAHSFQGLKKHHNTSWQLFSKVTDKIDFPLLVGILLLAIFGLIMVYDASVVQAFKDHQDKYHYIKQQLIWMALGLGCLVGFSYFNYHNFKRWALPLFISSLVLLLAVFIPGLGVSAGGAHRWLNLFGFTIQPTEIIKLSSVILFAYLFEKKVKSQPFFITLIAITVIVGLLQKDLGSAIVYFLMSLLMYLVAGAPLRYFLTLIPLTIIGFIGFVASNEYRQKRIMAFLDPFTDPQGFSYHIAQVLIAIGSGGFLGVGLGQSRQKFEYIPEVTTDSIFAIVGEELGFVGCTVLILLFIFVLSRGFRIAQKAPDRFGQLLAFGLTCWIGIQAVINLAAMVSLVPLTGVPLPFISYGGSALLINLTTIGILLNISRNSNSK